MGRPATVELEDVARAATRLISQGKRPTVDAIYEEVGRRGSRTTLNKHLRTFLEDFGKRGLSALPSAIPEALLPVVEDFWAQALVQASERYEKERTRWQDDLAAKDQAMDDLKAVIAERDALLADRDRFIQEQSARISALEAELTANMDLVRAEKSLITDLKADKQRLNSLVLDEREQAESRLQAAKEDWARERASLERVAEDARQLADDARKQMAEAEATHNKLTDYWIVKVDDARQQVSELKERHADDKKRWESDLLLQTRRADRYAMTISEKERIIESFQVCVDKQELVIASYYELLMFAVEQAGGTYLEKDEKEMPF